MAEPKWTIGPWRASFNGACWQVDAAMHAIVTTQFCYATETEANARLIAAAPDMAEALTAIAAVFLRHGSREEYDNAYRQAGIAALAKARGES